ncbi:MAG: helix-hairpin-helix domain-containing protein [Bacteroidales bacterium]|nr:helix-hairpin-helix domain-containing protein [Bacteroidales bacterium]
MIKRLLRELYLLPRGEQRALVGVTLLLLLSLLLRIVVQFLPGREPAGVEEFEQEARAVMAAFARADTMERVRTDAFRRPRAATYDRAVPFAQPININRADSVQLLPLPGIGPVFAGRIVKYRNLLGGFVHMDQLAEVYGMPVETIDLIRSRVYIDSTAIRKIQLDSATFRELLKHPYLEYEEVKALVEYRSFAGSINSLIELLDNHILSDTTINLIGSYFDFR